VPLTDKYPLAVTFIIGPVSREDGTTSLEPIGTGFVVNVPTRYEGLFFEYVVTASHIVEGDRRHTSVFASGRVATKTSASMSGFTIRTPT
jgi:hypothetical protein